VIELRVKEFLVEIIRQYLFPTYLVTLFLKATIKQLLNGKWKFEWDSTGVFYPEVIWKELLLKTKNP